ncbi:DUF2934 domain-containing protein [Roseibium salinum]|uniref:DUF2934 domain-containing protein n=1 Tax=Roseibium salinum TaxID=1604349 RepID=A0ABT3R4D8_9HYPH|nr:DUF2934 domain-containing protein [Roseibium sp. DSM 29163]MCX2723950.1 DUF2934 domain-containing protein [Roseibium sp. DSM 29163]MDN3718239.1 DUF2934 domain-containing protein [Roseibium salinum]
MSDAEDRELDRRIEERARHLWEAAGKPKGQMDEFREEARQLIALEEDPKFATRPVKEATADTDGAESGIALENQGEFPTLTDQGETTAEPKWPRQRNDDGT